MAEGIRLQLFRWQVARDTQAPPAKDSGGWVLSPHRVWDSHVPECFPYIRFSTDEAPAPKP